MKWTFANVGILIFGLFGILIITFFNELTVSNEQDYYTLKDAVEAAMLESVDITYFRLTGGIKINQEKFVENLTRRFAKVATYGEGNYNLEFYQISETPPKVSVRVVDATNSYNIFGTFGADPTQVNIVNEITAIMDVYGYGRIVNVDDFTKILDLENGDVVYEIDNKYYSGNLLPSDVVECKLYDDKVECYDGDGDKVVLEEFDYNPVNNPELVEPDKDVDDATNLCAVSIVDDKATHYSNADMFSTITQAQAHDYFLNTWFDKTYSDEYEYCKIERSQRGDYCWWLIYATCYKECDELEESSDEVIAIPDIENTDDENSDNEDVDNGLISVNVVKFEGYNFVKDEGVWGGKTYYEIIPKYSYYLLHNNYTYVPIDISAPMLQGNYSCVKDGTNVVCTYNGKTYNYKMVPGVFSNEDSPLKCFKVSVDVPLSSKKEKGYYYSKAYNNYTNLYINWNSYGFEGFYYLCGNGLICKNLDNRPCSNRYYDFYRFEFADWLYYGGVGVNCGGPVIKGKKTSLRFVLGEENEICNN